MADPFERDDDCAGVYRKSLLYLIRNALEDQYGTDLLGLEISLRARPELARCYGKEFWSVDEPAP